MSNERFLLEYLNSEAYYIDCEQIYTDKDEQTFKINNYITMSDEQVVECLNKLNNRNKSLGDTNFKIMETIIDYDTTKKICKTEKEVIDKIKNILGLVMI